MAFKLLQKVLGSAAAEPLSATSVKCSQALLQRIRVANTHALEVGDSTLASGAGIELVKPVTDAMLPSVNLVATGTGNTMDLSLVYIIGTSGEGVNIFYETF